MLDTKIRPGFHRIGIVLTVPCVAVFVIGAVIAAFQFASLPLPEIIADAPDGQKYRFPDGTPKSEIMIALNSTLNRKLADWEVVVYSNQMYERGRAETAGFFAVGGLLLGAIAYGSSWVIGWIASGFTQND